MEQKKSSMEKLELKILIIGNLGYIGPILVQHLSEKKIGSLTGLDNGYFRKCLVEPNLNPEFLLEDQIFKDVRDLEASDFKKIDKVVYLAAISNDPMGNEFKKATFEINKNSAILAAKLAKKSNVKKFIFISSCSLYGSSDKKPRSEDMKLDPLTNYAKSKAEGENELEKIASKDFKVICLRFPTACGYSPRFRLDLVLNDLVASAIFRKEIKLLSDGKSWRPLIHVKDISLAIEWALDFIDCEKFLVINVGTNNMNYKIIELAREVSNLISETKVVFNKSISADKRSYKVDFSLYERLAPNHQPKMLIKDVVNELIQKLGKMKLNIENYYNSDFVRLYTIKELKKKGLINNSLRWVN